jgi:glycerol-3-phosphate dehydrogenase
MAVDQLEEIKALFWQMTAQRLRQYVDSGQLEAEIRAASKNVLTINSGNSLGLLNPSSSPNQKRLPG